MATHWRYRAVALCAFAALVWVAAGLAGFDVTRWGSPGFEDGQFTNVLDVAVGPTGTVYASDTTPGRIQWFTRDGKFIGSNPSSSVQYLAVDSTGIYVSRSSAGGRVQHLTLIAGTGPQ